MQQPDIGEVGNPPRQKRQMTDKQKVARLANLEKGRLKRLGNVNKKKDIEDRSKHTVEYDLSSEYTNDSSSDSEGSGDFVISKKKTKFKENKSISTQKPIKRRKDNTKAKPRYNELDKYNNDIDELKKMVYTLANLQKEQHRAVKKQSKKTDRSARQGSTKIVVLPQNTQAPTKPRTYHDSTIELLRKSLLM